jgi:hypothetical protein
MPLQIRRGTDAERIAMTQKLTPGELLWVTDAKKLYVGDGTTASSILPPVTGFNAEDAQDAAGLMLQAGPHTGITFTYDDFAGTLSAAVSLSDYNGTIKASSFNGSVVANDSTLIINGETGTVLAERVSGTFTGSVVGNVTGNLTGNVIGNLTGNTSGYHSGDVKGSVFADDSTLIIDGVADRINIGTISSTTGTMNLGTADTPVQISVQSNTTDMFNFIGVITGALGGTSTVGLNVSRGTLGNPVNTQPDDIFGGFTLRGYYGGTYLTAGSLVSGWDADANLSTANPRSSLLLITGNNGDGFNIASFDGKGVLSAPVIKAQPYISTLTVTAVNSGTKLLTTSSTAALTVGDAITFTSVIGNIVADRTYYIASIPGGGTTFTISENDGGVAFNPGTATGSMTARFPNSPSKGWIIFDALTNQFKGWNGSSWALLG